MQSFGIYRIKTLTYFRSLQSIKEQTDGAANVAAGIRALGLKTCLLGLVGQDPEAKSLSRLLTQDGVESCLIPVPNKPTILKHRILKQEQIFFRLDTEEFFAGMLQYQLASISLAR